MYESGARNFIRSFTYDNDTENALHREVNQALGSRSYFCAPYHSWDLSKWNICEYIHTLYYKEIHGLKGLVENTIGLLRQYFPKKTNFYNIKSKDINTIQHIINNRPRKCLGFRTPAELFLSHLGLEFTIRF